MKTVKVLFFVVAFLMSGSLCAAEVLHDRLDDEERSADFGVTKSHRPNLEMASRFALSERSQITGIIWSGLIDNAEKDRYDFEIRIYETELKRPALEPFYVLTAEAEILPPNAPHTYPYIFSYTLPLNIQLPAGTYWISILYDGPKKDAFRLAFEKDKLGTFIGHGGAIRKDASSAWLPTPLFIPYSLCRGFSVRIEGEVD